VSREDPSARNRFIRGLNRFWKSETMPAGKLLYRVWRSNGTGSDRTPEGGTMSEELLNLDLLKNEELDVEGHAKKDSAEEATEAKGDDEVEAHLLSENLLDL